MAAKPDQIKAEITLEIDSDTVSPDKFYKGVRSFFGLLTSVARSISGAEQSIRWNVRVHSGSILIGVVPQQTNTDLGLVEAVKSTLNKAIDILETEATIPEHFPQTAMRYLYNLASLASENGDATRVQLWVKNKPKRITQHSAANVSELIGGIFEDYGSVEGRLRMIADNRGRLQFIIEEPIHAMPIRCNVSEELLPRAIAAFRKRVEVHGSIRYRRDGTPASITVADLIEFPTPESIPDFRSVHGILREST